MNAIDLTRLGLSPEAKAARIHAIGGSDANVIMGDDTNRLYRLWQEKRGEAEPQDLSDNLAVQMGSYTEPFNVAWFEKQTGLSVLYSGMVCRDGPLPFMACTLDGLVHDAAGDEKLGIFEAKHCGVRNADAELFERYVPQLTHNCLTAGERRAWLSCFKGNGDWVMFEYALDDDYAARLIEAERSFWDCVEYGTPPVPAPEGPKPKPVGVVEYDMSTSNAWASHAADYIETQLAADRHEIAKKELKALVPDDASKCFGHGIIIKRDKRGSLRFATTGDDE